ncbi:MAG: hypothetical protein ABFS22_12565 [Pseudomonadota bacterium]
MVKIAGSEAHWRWMRKEMIEQKRGSKLLYSQALDSSHRQCNYP